MSHTDIFFAQNCNCVNKRPPFANGTLSDKGKQILEFKV